MWLVQTRKLQKEIVHHLGKTKVFVIAEWLAVATFTLGIAGC